MRFYVSIVWMCWSCPMWKPKNINSQCFWQWNFRSVSCEVSSGKLPEILHLYWLAADSKKPYADEEWLKFFSWMYRILCIPKLLLVMNREKTYHKWTHTEPTRIHLTYSIPIHLNANKKKMENRAQNFFHSWRRNWKFLHPWKWLRMSFITRLDYDDPDPCVTIELQDASLT